MTNRHINLPINPDALDTCSSREAPAKATIPHSNVAHSEVRPATLRPKRKRVPWNPEEIETILKMKEEGFSWEEIYAALPHRTPGAIQVQYSTKLKSSTGGSDDGRPRISLERRSNKTIPFYNLFFLYLLQV
jgi:hypothetical protein